MNKHEPETSRSTKYPMSEYKADLGRDFGWAVVRWVLIFGGGLFFLRYFGFL